MKYNQPELTKMSTLRTFLICAVLTLSLLAAITPTAHAEYNEEVDYMSIMISACVAGDYATGDAACIARNEKIAAIESEYAPINFEDLWLISKIMYAEAGSEWLSDEWKMCVGEVVLNRVASPEFPNTVREVLEQPGQYYGKNSRYFKELLPSERCVRLAVRLLEGERVIDDPAVVFQANFTQGSGVHTKYYDKYLGWTYFCYSAHMSCYDR